MMRKGLAAAALAASALWMPGPVSADDIVAPNIFGTTGLVTIPTAHSLRYREALLHFHAADGFHSYGGAYGLSDRLEVGLTLLIADPDNPLDISPRRVRLKTPEGEPPRFAFADQHTAPVNAKYVLRREGKVWPAIAVGVTDLFGTMTFGSSFYAVGTKTLKLPTPLEEWFLRVSAGIGSGAYDLEPFAGVELGLGYPFTLLTFGLPASAMADFSDGSTSFGGRVYLPLGFVVEAGFVRNESIMGSVSFRRRF